MQYMKVDKIEDLLSSTDIRLIEARIISYLVHLKNVEKLSCGTANGYLAAIMLFYAVNDYTLNRKKISRYLPEPRKLSEDRGYNSDEIRLMLEGSDIRVRALILPGSLLVADKDIVKVENNTYVKFLPTSARVST